MARPLSPEFLLAAACATWPPSDRRTVAIHTAAARPIDWHRFLRVGKRHQVVGLIHDGLVGVQSNIPSDIAQEIYAQMTTVVRENLAVARESLRIQRVLDDADLPVLFVKGSALAMLAFGKLGLRSSQDIDLLVPYEKLSAVTAAILRAGYRRFDPPADISEAQLRLLMPLRKDLGFVHQDSGMRVELHWRLFLNPHAMAGESTIRAASRVVPLAGAAGLRTLGEEDLFVYLCMHGALHWWNRLKWLADINALLTAVPDGAVEHLVSVAEARGAGRAAAQALLLCRRILATPLPDRLMATPSKSSTVRWLEATALNAIINSQGERELREERFGTTRGSLSTVLLSRSWRYRLSELAIQLTNPSDVVTLPLPQQLRFLYPVLRLPFWLWRHTVQYNARRKTDDTFNSS
jgi:hypothetical protein